MEIWRPIPGYEGRYEVSNRGRVASYCLSERRVLALGRHRQGYSNAALWTQGKVKQRTVHSLVMEAFVGPRPPGLVVRHLDGDATNNVLENLAYGTYSENTQDMIRHGNCAKLNQAECVNGHPYDEANTYRRPDGRRKCRACNRERERRRHQTALRIT